MVIDCVTWNGEVDLFELRYNILKDYVDEFIVVEFDKTFSGKPKEFKFNQLYPRVKYCRVTEEQWSKYLEMAENSPNTVGADHWKTEFAQKESIKDCLTHLDDDDIVFIGDCDEIWNPSDYNGIAQPIKVKLAVYTYYLNNRSDEEFWGTLVAEYGAIKNECLNHLRTNATRLNYLAGWHFTSLKDGLKQKLEDSYTAESYATPEVLESLENNINNNKDFLGRDFKYRLDETDWPA